MPKNYLFNYQEKCHAMLAVVKENYALVPLNLSENFKKLVVKRYVSENILIIFLQFIGLTFAEFSLPFSFASGTAVAFLFMRGSSILPGIVLGNFLGYWCLHLYLRDAGILAAVEMLQFFLLYFLTCYYICHTLVFVKVKQFIYFILLCSLLFFFASYLTHLPLQIFLSNLSGVIIFSIALVTWDTYFSQINELRDINKYYLIYYIILVILSVLCLMNINTFFLVALYFFIFLLLIYLSFKFAWCGVVFANAMIGFVINFAIYITPITIMRLPILQISLMITMGIGLMVAIISQ